MAPRSPLPRLACVLCYFTRRGAPPPAFVVLNGYSVCPYHVAVAAGGGSWHAMLVVAGRSSDRLHAGPDGSAE